MGERVTRPPVGVWLRFWLTRRAGPQYEPWVRRWATGPGWQLRLWVRGQLVGIPLYALMLASGGWSVLVGLACIAVSVAFQLRDLREDQRAAIERGIAVSTRLVVPRERSVTGDPWALPE